MAQVYLCSSRVPNTQILHPQVIYLTFTMTLRHWKCIIRLVKHRLWCFDQDGSLGATLSLSIRSKTKTLDFKLIKSRTHNGPDQGIGFWGFFEAQESNSAVHRHTLNILCGHTYNWHWPTVACGATLYKVDNTSLSPLYFLSLSLAKLCNHTIVQLLSQFHFSSFLNFPCRLFTMPDNIFFISFFKIMFFNI